MADSTRKDVANPISIKVWLWAAFIFILLALVSLPSIILVAGGIIPTFVAWVCDRSDEKYSTFCVGGLNFSGIFPYMLTLWVENHSIEAAMEIFSDVFALVVMYGAAGIGWALFLSLPPVVAAFINVMAQTRLATLKKNQTQLVEDWGPEVPVDAAKKVPQTT